MTCRRYVRELAASLKEHLSLHDWSIELCWDKKQPDDSEDGQRTVAWIFVDSRYLNAYLHLCPLAEERFREEGAAALCEVIVHEFAHILLDPLYDFGKKLCAPQAEEHLQFIHEQQTQRITRVLLKTIPRKFLHP